MSKKKLYLIFTTSIHFIGGAELYTAGKADYLKKNGWEVQCYSCYYVPAGGKSAIPSLNEDVQKGHGELQFLIMYPYNFRKFEQEIFLEKLIDTIGISNPQDYEIIIESQHITVHFWAELLAERFKARHFAILLHEENGYGQSYRDNADYFYFKWNRNELIASDNVLRKIFNGYKNVTTLKYKMPETIHEQDPIKNVASPALDKITKLDWNICHIGRMEKAYVPYVIEGVAKFAQRHPDKKINFMFVGDHKSRENFILETFKGINNVRLIAFGNLVPIPRLLFSKVDVVCAISQSARFAANEGILTIVGSAKFLNRTPGVLGYDTEEQAHGEGTFSYVEALENVLVKRLYDNKKYSLPKLRPAEEYYENFWTIVNNAAQTKEYYTERISQERIRNWTAIFPFGSISRGARVILFGATEIAKDYKKQIETQQDADLEFGEGYIKKFVPKPYCTILATVDEHPENFDNSVSGVERLKQKDYDVIIITTFANQAQAACDKIVQIVPDMANRIIYKFRTLQV